jgi:hypothetical protein
MPKVSVWFCRADREQRPARFKNMNGKRLICAVRKSEAGRDRSTSTDMHRCISYMHRAKSEDRKLG